MSTCLHRTLTCARTLYIGKAAPTPCHDGLTAIQKPLFELYQKPERQKAMQDQECILYAFTSGLMMRPVNRLDKEIWLRIQDLESCSAVKAYRAPNACQREITFVPADSDIGQSIDSPSIFSVVIRRGEGLKISDCYAFICFSDETALVLVKACQQAFSNRSGWTNEKPNLVELGLERAEEKVDNECYVDDAKDDCGPEYYEKPKLSGFFYAPRSDLIQKFKVGGEDGFGRLVSDEPQMIEHFTHCEPEPEPEPKCTCQSSSCCHIHAYQITPGAITPGYQAAPQQQLLAIGGGAQQPQLIAIGSGLQQQGVPQQQQVVVPQQAQLYYGSNVDSSAYDQYKVDKKALKKAQKKQKELVQDDGGWRTVYQGGAAPMNEYVTEEVRYVTQPTRYAADPQDPVYAKVLPRGVRVNGLGDYGPPQGGVYGGADVYSRQLPADAYYR